MVNQFKKLILIFVLGALLNSCAVVQSPKNNYDYTQKIAQLKQSLTTDPKNPQKLQELGVLYFEMKQYVNARKTLIRAFKLDPKDAKTMAYLGMALEAEKKNKLALKVYERYEKVSRFSSYRNTMAMRYRLLKRNMMRDEMRALMENEQNLNIANVSPKSVAVFPLAYKGRDNKYESLGKGISEMMITDLSQVPNLQVVERVRIQALFDEVALGQSGMVEESSAQRFGKLLGASKIVHGELDVTGSENLNMDVAYWDVFNDQFPGFINQQDDLDNLFKLEKDIVFGVIDNMGIELTPQQREKIQQIPTKNMQAFLAYSMALEQEDAENFEKAAQLYQISYNLDPNFKMAGEKLQQSKEMMNGENIEIAGKENIRSGADPSIKPPANNMIANRLQHLNRSIGSNFIPGIDNRESSQEAYISGADVFEDLPLPPEPPSRE